MPERDPAGARAAATGNESSPGQVAARFEEGRDERITRYGPLVKYVVRRLAIALPPTLDYADLLSFGTIGLIQAVDRFEATAHRFSAEEIVGGAAEPLLKPYRAETEVMRG